MEEIIKGANNKIYKITNTKMRFDPDHDSYYIDYDTYEILSGLPYKSFRENKKISNLYFNESIDKRLKDKIIFYFSQFQELRNGDPPRSVCLYYYCPKKNKIVSICYSEGKKEIEESEFYKSDGKYTKPKLKPLEYLIILKKIKRIPNKFLDIKNSDKASLAFLELSKMPKIILMNVFQFIDLYNI